MVDIVTNFGTATVVTPAGFQLNFTPAEAATWLAEITKLLAPSQNQTLYPTTYAIFTTLQSCMTATAPIGTGGTAPPTTTQVPVP